MKKTLVALAASCAVTAVFAQSSAPAATAPASASSAAVSAAASAPPGSKREARVEERIAQLHSSLKITAAEETQWSAFADVMRENARTMGDLYRQRIAQRDTMSALDDMKQYQQITQANADGTKRLVDAFEPLYASLSPEQKKLADTSFRREGQGRGRHDHARRHPRASSADAASTVKP
ncbi:Spy/CpxP family protein refolding chaperone [Caballeronia sp. Lep1P3]|uniref:Spy/CpxP family protein refolding chaperone n=1 Tax=Caballeronia sp. Lep1P3 TaxID=2878150 RepID=UPI001FD238DE|nr:Spy/CpxP family protein refolding chaperone [Caballeronia sp. Lep1P3]